MISNPSPIDQPTIVLIVQNPRKKSGSTVIEGVPLRQLWCELTQATIDCRRSEAACWPPYFIRINRKLSQINFVHTTQTPTPCLCPTSIKEWGLNVGAASPKYKKNLFKIMATVLLAGHWHSIWCLHDRQTSFPLRWSRLKKEFSET